MPKNFWRMTFSFLAIVFVNFANVSNVHAVLNLADSICEIDTWNDIEDSHKATINNICNIRVLDEETLKLLMAKLEKLNLTEPAKTAVKGAIQGFKQELQNDLKLLITELNTLLKESLDQAGKLITKVDDRVQKRIDQITQAIQDTVKRFEDSIINVIQQAETSIINITKNTIKQTEDSIVNIVDEMVFKLESTAAKLNDELSQKFETIRQNIKTDIMFIGNYVSCKTSGAMVNFGKALKNVVQTLPFSKSQQKPCQSCQPSFFSSPDERECSCCRNVNLLDKDNKPQMTTNMRLFRYNVCRLKNELSGHSKIQDILDAYTEIQQWAIDIYCHSNTVRVGKYKPLIQVSIEEETEKAYEEYLFWTTVSQ